MSSAVIGTKGVPRPEREQQIVATAVGEFAANGYARASMVAIARQAGISKPLIYQYFGSKDGLYLACLHDVAGSLLARLEQAELDVDDTVASRIHPLRAIFEALEPQRDAWRLLFDTSVPVEGPIGAAAADYQRRLGSLAASGSERFLAARGTHSAADASALTAVWMGLVSSVVTWWLEHPDESAVAMTARCERLLSAVLS
ncbi:TetR/AcrR family transcriptional regulator [uncultured Jatrophihabitans sp.]|uniref:TetR/AcrR family transcriptional regulator n=1 Tax=uncultured Jatrophihabitans sp. TaxID=1610747 RepID=UPI0035CC415A